MSPEEIRRIAELSRLEFTDEEIGNFAHQFTGIVEYIGKISAADLGNVEPLIAVNEGPTPMRTDVAGQCLTTEQALSNAPSKNEAFFKVPKVLG